MAPNKSTKPLSEPQLMEMIAQEVVDTEWATAFAGGVARRRLGPVWIVSPRGDGRIRGPWIYVSTRTGSVRLVDFVSPTGRLLRLGALCLLAVGVTLLVSRQYPREWCSDQLAESGVLTRICRDPDVTDPAVVAVGVVMLAALGVFFSEISGFGFTFRGDVQEARNAASRALRIVEDLKKVRKRLEETTQDLADMNQTTTERLDALEAALEDSSGSRDSKEGGVPIGAGEQTADGVDEFLHQSDESSFEAEQSTLLDNPKVMALAEEYEVVRGTMVSGPDRSARIQAIFDKMKTVLRGVSLSDRECEKLLLHPRRGVRLSVFAYLNDAGHVAQSTLPSLVAAAAGEDKPFGQYCALRAIKTQAKKAPLLDSALTRELERIARSAGAGTDRAREVASIMARERTKPSSDA